MSKRVLINAESTGSIPMAEVVQEEIDEVPDMTEHIVPKRKRKLTEISMNSTSSLDDEEEEFGSEEDLKKDKQDDGQKKNKVQQLKDAIMSGNKRQIESILSQKFDINQSDMFGRSALHNAVLKGIPGIVKTLLDHGADVNKKDDREDSSVHYAARADNPEILRLLVSQSECDVNMKGSNLYSPLHIAASLNKPDLCQILLENHANPNSQEENGKVPLGRAVETGAFNSAKYLLEYMKSIGISDDDLLYNQDFDGTTLLHLAVDSGFSEVVQLCIDHGSLIRIPRRLDRTTAFHMACEQGSSAIVQLLVQHDPKISKILLVNAEGVTPLHQAASSNSYGIAEILIEHGADVNARTNENRTPLMYAASRGGIDTVRILLEKGADPTIKDIDSRTAVYDAVGYPMTMEVILQDSRMAPLLSEKDLSGFSVGHFVAKAGDVKSMSLLLEKNKLTGSVVSDQLDTPLHVASKYGRHEVVRTILEKQGSKIINAQNGRNKTALHLACSGGHFKAAFILLDKGATIERDQNNRTALHEAAQKGAKKVVETVIVKHPHCLNFVDDNKDTALHLAVRNCHSEIIDMLLSLRKTEILKNSAQQNILDLAIQLDDSTGAMAIASHTRWREILETCTHGVTKIMKKMVVKMPEVAEKIFDNCVEIEGEKISDQHKVKFDLGVILRKSTPETKTSLEILEVIADNRIESCLTHKLTFIALSTKWNSYGWLAFVSSLLSVLVYLIPLSIIHATLEDNDSLYCPTRVNLSETGTLIYLLNISSCPKNHLGIQISQYVVLIIIAILVLKECFQIVKKKLAYFTNPINLIELVAFISAIISLLPTCECKWGIQKETAAVALFIGWINLIMYLQGLPFYGKYVIMLYTMFVTLIKVMVLFCLFALAFGTTFHLSMDQEPFTSLPNILMNMFIMMLGEINYVDTFMPWNKLFYPFMTHLVLILFCLTMPIILMNMLVGLSVGDIDAIERRALIDRYVLQIELLNNLEESFPIWLLKKVQKNAHIYYPNKKLSIRERIFEILIGFGQVDKGEDSENDGKELQNKVAELQGKLDEQSHIIDEVKSTMMQMYDMMKAAETAREEERKAKASTVKSKSVVDIGGSLTNFSLPGASLPGISLNPFGSKKTEQPQEETPKESSES